VFNSSSTVFTMDIYKKLHPGVSERRLVLVGRIATVALVGLGVLWIPFLRDISGQLYRYLQSVQAYIAPPIAAVFLLGVFTRRITGRAAMTTLVGGFAIGMTRLVAELNKDALGGVALWFAELNFLHFAMLLFAVCVALLIGVSFTSPSPDPDSIRGLTYATTVAEDRAASRATWGRAEVIHSVIIVAAILGILITFSPLGLGARP